MGGPSPAQAAAKANWQGELQAHLAKYKRYPSEAQRRGKEGTNSLRFVVDASGQGDLNYGDRRLTVYSGQWASFTASRRIPSLPAGLHTIDVQLARKAADPAGECQLDSAEYSAVHLVVTVR